MNRVDYRELAALLRVATRGMAEEEARQEMMLAIDSVLNNFEEQPFTLSGFYKNPRGGSSVQNFEKLLEAFCNTPYARTCTNGTSALHLALLAAGIGVGHNVAVPALTFSATATACRMVGANPVIVDVNPDTYCMDVGAFKKLNEKMVIDAVIPVHLLGVPVEMDRLNEICRETETVVIEDNAQGLGAKYKGKALGSWGDLATLSFQETKLMTSGGEGGAVLTGSAEAAKTIEFLRNHGQQYGKAGYTCYNYRMTELQAAFGEEQLRKLPMWNVWQRENRETLKKRLEPLGFKFQTEPPESRSTFYIMGTTVDSAEERTRVYNLMKAAGRSEPTPGNTITMGYTMPIYGLELLKSYRCYCPVSEWLTDHYIWFDVGRWVTPTTFEAEAEKIVELIEQ